MASVASGCSIKYQVSNVDKDATEGQEVPTGCSSYRSLIWLFVYKSRYFCFHRGKNKPVVG